MIADFSPETIRTKYSWGASLKCLKKRQKQNKTKKHKTIKLEFHIEWKYIWKMNAKERQDRQNLSKLIASQLVLDGILIDVL